MSWIYPRRVVYIHLCGNVTQEDVAEQVQQMRSWLADAIAPVHVVVNGSGVERYNLTLNQALAIYPPLDPKVGWTVFYGTNRVTRFFASTMMQLVKGNFSFFGSYEETLAFLVRTDQTLEAFQSELAQV